MRTTPPKIGPLERYGIAVLAAVVAFAASYATWPFLKTMPWFFFFAAIMVSAWFGGQGPSLVDDGHSRRARPLFLHQALRHIHVHEGQPGTDPCLHRRLAVHRLPGVGQTAGRGLRASGKSAVRGDRDEHRRRGHRDRRRGPGHFHEWRRRETDRLEQAAEGRRLDEVFASSRRESEPTPDTVSKAAREWPDSGPRRPDGADRAGRRGGPSRGTPRPSRTTGERRPAWSSCFATSAIERKPRRAAGGKRRRGDGPDSSRGWPKSPLGSTRPTTSTRSSAS